MGGHRRRRPCGRRLCRGRGRSLGLLAKDVPRPVGTRRPRERPPGASLCVRVHQRLTRSTTRACVEDSNASTGGGP
ncbi:hypothetical protein [Pandoravirus japonicus]|uniref:Uncharacterized protein n=1 Tax=Pandoravirus japonicus TaxID=2823154 RepID=A0A811BRP8_9VIRU|nr:hypothetical protein [Pandoravirus japonicus]